MKKFTSLQRRIGIAVLTIALAIGVSSCYYDYGLSTSDYDAILTNWDPKTDFGNYKTFVLADSVFHLVGDDDEDDITRKYDETLLDAVRHNFQSKGYVEIAPDTNNLPDFVVTVSIAKNTYVGGGWYYPYWPPYWGPGWGWYPGYWPGGGYYYSYETGTVFVDLLDVDDIKEVDNPGEDYIRPRWSGVMEGLISNESSNVQRILAGIDRMFYQSPVLVANGGTK